MGATKDSGFEDRLANRMEKAGWYHYKIPDKAPPPRRGNGAETDPLADLSDLDPEGGSGEKEATSKNYTVKNRYDFIVLVPTITPSLFFSLAIEAKTCARERLDFNRIKAHQLKGLSKFPGSAGVVVEFRAKRRCFFIRIAEFLSIIDACGKKSVNLSDIEQWGLGTELPVDSSSRETRTYYDVRQIPTHAVTKVT